ncbi:MAG: autotransporter outer membrane beta-barrel domain-containing protein, partial [Brevundimonas sp.]
AAVLGARADHDATPHAYGADSETYGLVGGFDFAATDVTRIGVALSASRTDFDEDGADNGGRIDDLTLAGYAAARKGWLFGEASAGVGYRDYSYDRRDILGASGTVLEAQGIEGRSTSDGWAAFADARFGAVITAGTAELRPFVHGRLVRQSIDAFEEAGADIFSQSVGETDLEHYEYGPGVEAVLDAGGGLRADLSVRYDFRSGDDDYAVPVSLMGSAVPARIGSLSDGVTVNGGVEARLGDAWQASARGYWSGGDDRAAGGVSLGLSYTF